MHSFQPSRGRIFFEVFCALTIAGSCAGAWSQTGAWAFLPAAAVSLLYALIRMFDMAGLRPVSAAEPKAVPVAEPVAEEPVAAHVLPEPVEAAEQPLSDEQCAEIMELVEATSRPSAGRHKGGSRKGTGRRAGATKEAAVVEEVVVVEEVEVVEEVAAVEEVVLPVAEAASDLPSEAECVEPAPSEDVFHSHVAPLFEPEPFVRQQRTVFGRKAG